MIGGGTVNRALTTPCSEPVLSAADNPSAASACSGVLDCDRLASSASALEFARTRSQNAPIRKLVSRRCCCGSLNTPAASAAFDALYQPSSSQSWRASPPSELGALLITVSCLSSSLSRARAATCRRCGPPQVASSV